MLTSLNIGRVEFDGGAAVKQRGGALVAGASPRTRMTSDFSSGATGLGGYAGASNGRRMVKFSTSDPGANSLLQYEGPVLRARSRALVRSNTYAKSAERAWVSKLVGTGIKPRFAGNCKLPEPLQRQVLLAWEEWQEQCDARGEVDFYGLQAQAARELFAAGEVLARLRPRRTQDGMRVPLQVQLLEPDLLPHSQTLSSNMDKTVVAGVELNELGARVAYHMLREHPRDRIRFSGDMLNTQRVPAFVRLGDGSVVANVLHAFEPARSGQVRGEPLMTAAIVNLYQLMLFNDAELDRKGMAANIFGWTTMADAAFGPASESPDSDGIQEVELQPNTIATVPAGQDLKLEQMQDIPQAYADFFAVQLRAIASGIGLSYESLTGDLSEASFSSSRMGENEAQSRIQPWQSLLVHQLCRPTWRRWVRTALIAGAWKDANYPANAVEYERVFWQPPRKKSVNPVDDVKAAMLRVEGGISSRSQEIREDGRDPDEVREEIEKERASGWTADPSTQPVIGRPPNDPPPAAGSRREERDRGPGTRDQGPEEGLRDRGPGTSLEIVQ